MDPENDSSHTRHFTAANTTCQANDTCSQETNIENKHGGGQKQDGGETPAKCNGIRTPRGGNAKDRWGKLKTTMTVANSITPKKKAARLDRGDSFLRKFSTRNQAESKDDSDLEDVNLRKVPEKKKRERFYVIHPSGGLMFYWLGIITLSVMYNLWTCIAREAFREIQHGYMVVWLCMDGFCDFIYVLDIFVQLRTGYLQQGLMVYDSTKLCKRYLKDRCFILDLLCLIPLDVVQFYIGVHPLLRFPRFVKVYRSVRFMHLYESRTAYPNLLRVANLSHILFLGSHWFAAFYYLISEAEGFNGDWSYPKPENQYASVTRKYLASLYWSTLTLTTIGDLPPPDTNWQYVFVIVSYLIGVFIFATIVGQVGNVITNRNASRQEFERLLDGAKFYMQMHNVPPDLQRRVQRWYDYVWTRGRLNCNDINSLGLLPDKLKTELALHVNLGTLKKVTIFQKCRPEFLHDLMLKMRAYIFTPGDLICRRGEVAREMFIIADGVVEILGKKRQKVLNVFNKLVSVALVGQVLHFSEMSEDPFSCDIGHMLMCVILVTCDRMLEQTPRFGTLRYRENATVLTQMSTGDFFGEIGILNLDGGINRRTADVRSVGYSELFVLSREDVLAALKDHPDAEEILTLYARKRLDEIQSLRSAQEEDDDKESSQQIIREFGQRRLKETEEHRKMAKSAPSSPDLSAAWQRRQSGKSGKREQDKRGIPKVKRLTKLPNMSPNLRKMFNRKIKNGSKKSTKSVNDIQDNLSGLSCENSEDEFDSKSGPITENGIHLSKTHLGIIKEKDLVPGGDTSDKPVQDVSSKNFALASVVINLLKNRRKTEYNAVNTSDDDTDANFDKISISNIGEVVNGRDCQGKVGRCQNTQKSGAQTSTEKQTNNKTVGVESVITHKQQKQNNPRLLTPPRIVLTQDTDNTNSSSSDSEVFEIHPPTPHPARRSHVTRKSTPCIMTSSEDFTEKYNRRISLPPPLDLPIEVPRFSKFRGLSRNTDVSIQLERFKKSVDHRLDLIENSCRDSMTRMEKALEIHEKSLENILRRFTEKQVKVSVDEMSEGELSERSTKSCLKCENSSVSFDLSASSEHQLIDNIDKQTYDVTSNTVVSDSLNNHQSHCDHGSIRQSPRGVRGDSDLNRFQRLQHFIGADNIDRVTCPSQLHVTEIPDCEECEDTRL